MKNIRWVKLTYYLPPHPAVLIVLIFLNLLLWVWAVPFNAAPDEWAHLESVNRILNGVYFSTDASPSQWIIEGNGKISVSYALLPPLSYILAAFFTLIGHNSGHAYLFARLGSAVSIAALVFIIFNFFKKLKADDWTAYLGASTIGFIPQLSFLGAYINSDALSFSLPFLTLLLAIEMYLKVQINKWQIFLLGQLTGLAMLTRYNAYPLLFACGVLTVLKLQNNHKIKNIFLYVWGALLTGGWWFVFGLFRGDVTGVQTMYRLLELVRQNEFRRIGVIRLLVDTNWLPITFKSSFAAFDWNSIFLPNLVYIILAMFLAFLALYCLSHFSSLTSKQKIIFSVLTGSGILTISQTIYQSAYGSYQPQGRHWLSGVLPIVVYMVYIFMKNNKHQAWIFLGSLAILVTNIYSLTAIIVPKYWAFGKNGLEKYHTAMFEMVFQKPGVFSLPIFVFVLILWLTLLTIHVLFFLKRFFESGMVEP